MKIDDKNTKLSNINENTLNEKHNGYQLCKTESHSVHNSNFKNEGIIAEIRNNINSSRK